MEKVNVFYGKDLGRTAFKVAFGLTVGKAIGDLVAVFIGGATSRIIQGMAEHGNGIAQKACNAAGVKYKKNPDESEE